MMVIESAPLLGIAAVLWRLRPRRVSLTALDERQPRPAGSPD